MVVAEANHSPQVQDLILPGAEDRQHAGQGAGANAILLLNADDGNALETPCLAGTAANQIADLVDEDGAGFFVYWTSSLGLNRLAYSENLNDASAVLKILSRQTDLTGQDAIDALEDFSASNFRLIDDMAYM